MEDEEEFILSKRDREVFSHGGHLYWFDKLISAGTIKSWRCAKRLANGKKCCGRVYTNLDDEFLRVAKDHAAHEGDAAGVEVARALTELKRRAVETQEIPSQIRTNALQNLSQAARGRFPNKAATNKVIHRARGNANAAPAQPVDRASIVIPDNYQNYEYEPGQFENFLTADSGDENRILIFGRQDIETWIGRVKKIYVDGTFRLAPSLFSQIFVVMAERGGFVIPTLYALLPNKQQVTYSRMIQLILNAFPNFCPEAISLDFDVINSFASAFAGSELMDACSIWSRM